MHHPFSVWLRLSALALLAVSGVFSFGCGEDGGTEPPPPATVRFEPPSDSLLLGTFEVFEFSVSISNGETVTARFFVDGSEVASGETYQFSRDSEGEVTVTAVADWKGREYRAEWSVEVSTEIVDEVPMVEVLTANSGPDPGSITVRWNAPPESQVKVPLADYIVSWSTSPIGAEDDLDLLPFSVQAHDGQAIAQVAELVGLSERVTHHIAVRARDVLGRVSKSPSPPSCESTGHYDLSGFTHSIDLNPNLGIRPTVDVLIDVEGTKTLTDANGFFSLPGLSDLGPQSIAAEEESGAIYYVIRTDPQHPFTRQLNLLMLPREILTLTMPTGPDSTVQVVDYVKHMTHNDGPGSRIFHGWQSYPVTVYVHDYVFPDGADGPVDYAAAFEYAVAVWNSVAGEELLRIERVQEAPTSASPGTGVFYAADYTPDTSANLGEVKIVRPSGTALYEAVPEWAIVHLRSSFIDDWIARYVVTHELGHTLGLDHSFTLDDIMYFAVQSSRQDDPMPSITEAFVARLLRHVGPEVDSSWYQLPDAE